MKKLDIDEIEDKMQSYIENGDIDAIENVFNTGYIPVQCLLMNGKYRTEYMDIHEYNNRYYEDFNSTEYSYFVDQWDRDIEWWLYIYNHDLKVYMKNDIDSQFSEKPTKKEYKEWYEKD
jgi:hypothetical protein